MEKVSVMSAIIATIEEATGMDFVWFLVLLFFLIVEIVLRLVPTKKQGSIFNAVLIFIQKIIDGLIPDKKKNN